MDQPSPEEFDLDHLVGTLGSPPDAPLTMPHQAMHGPVAAAATRRLPLPSVGVLLIRTAVLLFGLGAGLAAALLFAMIGAADAVGLDKLDWVRLALVFITTAWIGWGAALAGTGLIAGWVDRLRARMRATAAGPIASDAAVAVQGRCVVLVPVCNEDPVATFARIAAMESGLAEAGGPRVDIAILSDTRDPAVAAAERRWFLRLLQEQRGTGGLYYRRRTENRGRKAGNIEDFLTKSGAAWDYAMVLDADSLMEPETIHEMMRRMEADPGLGLLQSLPRVIRGRSRFGRTMQFSAALYAPVFTRGLAALQGNTGPFWGHNALVRIAAFAGSCGLPPLPGKAPFGGTILSHDTVEAAMLVRSGWRVRVDPDLEGSFEEAPENLVDHARRDRRWCQGNLQHMKVIGARGLAPWSRVWMAQGILAYLSALFWLAFVAATIAGTALAPPPGPWFGPMGPVFPIDETAKAIALAISVVTLLFAPKLLIALDAIVSGRAAGFGGTWQLLRSTVMEILISSAIAPLQMMFQTRAVLQVLSGLDGGWPSQSREGGRIGWAEARGATGFIVLGGLLAMGSVLAWAPDLILWLCPLAVPMIAAPFLVRYLSEEDDGSMFLVPQEAAPSASQRRLSRVLLNWRGGSRAPLPEVQHAEAPAPHHSAMPAV